MNDSLKNKLKTRLKKLGLCEDMAELVATRYCEHSRGAISMTEEIYEYVLYFPWGVSEEGFHFWKSFYLALEDSLGKSAGGYCVEDLL